MDILRGRPLSSSVLVIGDDAIEQDADVAGREPIRRCAVSSRPHLVDGARRRQHAVFFAEALQAILIGIDAAHVRDHQLLLALERRGAGFDAHELARLELLFEALDVVEELGGDLPGRVLQREQQELAAANRPELLVGAEKEAPALDVAGRDRRCEAVDSTCSGYRFSRRPVSSRLAPWVPIRTIAMPANTSAAARTMRELNGSDSSSVPSTTAMIGLTYA